MGKFQNHNLNKASRWLNENQLIRNKLVKFLIKLILTKADKFK